MCNVALVMKAETR